MRRTITTGESKIKPGQTTSGQSDQPYAVQDHIGGIGVNVLIEILRAVSESISGRTAIKKKRIKQHFPASACHQEEGSDEHRIEADGQEINDLVVAGQRSGHEEERCEC